MRAIDIDCPTCSAKAGRACTPVWNHDDREAIADNATRDELPAFTGSIDELVAYIDAIELTKPPEAK